MAKRFSWGGDVLQFFQQETGQGVMVAGLWQIQPELAVQLEDLQITRNEPGSRLASTA